jgi:hypothetical protein
MKTDPMPIKHTPELHPCFVFVIRTYSPVKPKNDMFFKWLHSLLVLPFARAEDDDFPDNYREDLLSVPS